jgi:hypothetical protein
MTRFLCSSCDWSGDQSQTSVFRNLFLGPSAYVDRRNGRSLPSCPVCWSPAVPVETVPTNNGVKP